MRLRSTESLETLLHTAQLESLNAATIPVLWDRCILPPDQNRPDLAHNTGINVLFLDGHVEFITLESGRWPLTETTMRLFHDLENL